MYKVQTSAYHSSTRTDATSRLHNYGYRYITCTIISLYHYYYWKITTRRPSAGESHLSHQRLTAVNGELPDFHSRNRPPLENYPLQPGHAWLKCDGGDTKVPCADNWWRHDPRTPPPLTFCTPFQEVLRVVSSNKRHQGACIDTRGARHCSYTHSREHCV
jgi:hypothetical protein